MDHQCKTPGCTLNVTEGYDYCLWCRSNQTHCKIGKFGYKKMSISVPWCYKCNRRVLLEGGKWLCDDCEEREG